MITTRKKALQQVMMDPAVDTTLTLVAAMVSLSKETVTEVVESGLLLMANVADQDPWVFKAMYAQSLKLLPEPTQEFYANLGKSATARRAMATDFRLMYGHMTETIHRDAASVASTTEEQASQVLAAAMPAMVRALGKANTNTNEMGFGRQLRNLNS